MMRNDDEVLDIDGTWIVCLWPQQGYVCVCVRMRQLGPHKMRNWGVPVMVVEKMDREF
jgi:hypothetical protein